MHTTLLADIPFAPELDAVFARLHVEARSEDATEVALLVEQAITIARPKALYGVAYVQVHEDDSVLINDIRFTSRVLRVNLDDPELFARRYALPQSP